MKYYITDKYTVDWMGPYQKCDGKGYYFVYYHGNKLCEICNPCMVDNE